MDMQTVADNLRRTIAGKQAMLNGLKASEKEGYYIIKHWLEINIEELGKILEDVELCIADLEVVKEDLAAANGRVRQLEQQISDDSWITNPDRMGGGGWTAEELDPNRGWK